jgi:cell division protein FtsB
MGSCVPLLRARIAYLQAETERLDRKVISLETENETLRRDNEFLAWAVGYEMEKEGRVMP